MGKTDSIVFYRSFYEAIEEIEDKDTKLEIYQAIFKYGLDGEETKLKGTAKAIFGLIKPQIDANFKKRMNGKKGGRPPANQNETKTKPNNNQSKTKPEPNVNVNVNGNVNVNENVNENGNVNGGFTPSTTAKPYGKFKNVFLEDYQIEDLRKEFSDIDKTIEKMSAYLAAEKKSYPNYYAQLRLWALRDEPKKKEKPKPEPEPIYTYDFPEFVAKMED